jgi:3-hydroxybutyryl-CoA dehydrogenase
MSDGISPYLSRPTLDLRTHPTVAVLGSGTMGQGIAQVTAATGHMTRIYDAVPERAQAALAAIGGQLEKLVAKGKIDAEASGRTLASIDLSTSVKAACHNADIIIEAAPEDMVIKVALLRDALDHAPHHAIISSNTSSLSITELGARLGAQDRTVGLHFFNPPPLMELLEVVRGLETSPATIEKAIAFASSLGKTPIVVRDVAGFASSRLGVILGAEAIRMVESGVAAARDIDKAMELGYRHPMGPLKLTDLVGLDVRLAILEHLQKEIGEQFRPPGLLRMMVRAGKLGKKSGEGFYVWKDGKPE